MAIVEVTIVPLGTGSPGVSEYVAEVHKELVRLGGNVNYQLTPMSTIIEGELDELLSLIRAMHEVPFRQGALRVSTSIKIDERRDKKGTMEQKLKSVENKIRK